MLRKRINNTLLGQYEIYDVYGEPPSSTSGWSTSVGASYTTICNGQTIIGGYNKFGVGSWATKAYSGLLNHNTVSVQWDAYFLDSWGGVSGNDSIALDVDGITRYFYVYPPGSGHGG